MVVVVGGQVSYTPDLDFAGTDSFTYSVADEYGLRSNVATVEIEMVPDLFPWQNSIVAEDVNADGVVSPIDALLIIFFLNTQGSMVLPVPPTAALSPPPFLDASGDNFVSPKDALQVIHYLNGESEGEGEGEGEYVAAVSPTQMALASAAEGEGQRLAGWEVASSISTEISSADTAQTDDPAPLVAVETTAEIREGVAEDPHTTVETLRERTIADWDDLLDDIAEDAAGARDNELIADLALNHLLHPRRDAS